MSKGEIEGKEGDSDRVVERREEGRNGERIVAKGLVKGRGRMEGRKIVKE